MTGEDQPDVASAPEADGPGEPGENEAGTDEASTDEAGTGEPGTDEADRPAASVIVSDDEVVRSLISSVHRDALPGFVLAHATSPLAWAELADIAHSEGREVEAYAYATVAHKRGLALLDAAGWSDGDAVSWSDIPNRAVLRAAYALRRAATAIGLVFEADALSEFLDAADADAIARIESEHTATQFITIIPPGATAPATMPPTESFVIRGED